MAEGIELGVEVEDNTQDATDGLERLEKALRDLGDRLEKNTKQGKADEQQTKKATRAKRLQAAAAKALTASTKILTGAVGASVVGLGALVALGAKATQVYKPQADALRALSDAIETNGKLGEDLTEVYRQQLGVVDRLAMATMFGDDQLQNSLATYQNIRGEVLSATQAQRTLSIITGAATKENKSLEEATKAVAKARQGDVGALRELTGITERQAKSLSSIKNEAERAAAATQILEDKYKGAAEQLDPFYRESKNAQDALGDLTEQIGETIVTSGFFAPIFTLITDVLTIVRTTIAENEVAIKQWMGQALEPVIEVLEDLDPVIRVLSPIITAVIVAVKSATPVMKVLWGTIKTIYSAIQALTALILEGMLGAFESLAMAGAKAARFIGEEGMARELDSLSNKARQYKDNAAKFLDQALVETSGHMLETAAAGDELIDTLSDAPAINAEVTKTLEKAAPAAAKAAKALRENKKAIDALTKSQEKNQKITGRGRGNAARDQAAGGDREAARKRAEEAKKRREEENKRRALALAQLDILKEEDARRRALLELQKAKLEIAQSDLLIEERRVALLEAEQTYRQTIRDLEVEAADKRAAQLAQATDVLAQFNLGGPLGALSQLGQGIDDVVAKYDAMAAAGASGSDALGAAMSSGFSLLSQTLSSAEEETGDFAALQAALQAAQGVMFGIMGNPVAAGAAFANSVAFGAVAAQAGESAPTGTGTAPSSARASSRGGAGRAGSEASMRMNARILAEELERRESARPVQITNIIGQNATFLESAESTRRRVQRETESSLRTRL
jgi:DNA repair exonuclease SbcCD ATPase subunit